MQHSATVTTGRSARAIAVCALLLASAGPAAADRVTGTAAALSGGVLEFQRTDGRTLRVRLAGISVPPADARCPPPAGTADLPEWACGLAALGLLAGEIAGETVECETAAAPAETGPPAGICAVQTLDLTRRMLEAGLAALLPEWRGRRRAWDEAETAARRMRAGVWSGAAR